MPSVTVCLVPDVGETHETPGSEQPGNGTD